MIVSSVTYTNWRNIASAVVPLVGGINVLWGMNAQGKSNILEGIYYFARGRSFRGAKDRELVRFGEPCASAAVVYRRDGYENDTKLEAVLPLTGKKRLTRNGAPLSSPVEMMGSFRAVLFCPANLSLVSGGPLERRTFLDVALSQLSGDYLTSLRRYSKLLTERNALLKFAADGNAVRREEWEVYAVSLAECGTRIAAYRSQYCTLLRDAVTRYFAGMTDGAEVPGLTYSSHVISDSLPPLLTEPNGTLPASSALAEKLCQNLDREIAAGSTLWGIHKDDVVLSLNERESRLYASQGQQRSIALSMKLAEAEIARTIGGEYPVILLDDVFSELDENRRQYLLDSLGTEERQIIVTSCEPDVVPERQAGVSFRHIENGAVVG